MYKACKDSKDQGGFHDFVEILKLYDKNDDNTMLAHELFKMLTNPEAEAEAAPWYYGYYGHYPYTYGHYYGGYYGYPGYHYLGKRSAEAEPEANAEAEAKPWYYGYYGHPYRYGYYGYP